MTERRQALFPGKSAATLLLLAVFPAFLFLSVLLDTRQALLSWTAPFALLLLSTAALILELYGRRDSTSPRRIGRRI
jgi:hypothetical protein